MPLSSARVGVNYEVNPYFGVLASFNEKPQIYAYYISLTYFKFFKMYAATSYARAVCFFLFDRVQYCGEFGRISLFSNK